MDREVAAEDEVAAILNLLDGELAVQVDGSAFLLRELGTYRQAPMVQTPTQDIGAEAVGGGLQGFGIGERQFSLLPQTTRPGTSLASFSASRSSWSAESR
jgi:hypothetical protein